MLPQFTTFFSIVENGYHSLNQSFFRPVRCHMKSGLGQTNKTFDGVKTTLQSDLKSPPTAIDVERLGAKFSNKNFRAKTFIHNILINKKIVSSSILKSPYWKYIEVAPMSDPSYKASMRRIRVLIEHLKS